MLNDVQTVDETTTWHLLFVIEKQHIYNLC